MVRFILSLILIFAFGALPAIAQQIGDTPQVTRRNFNYYGASRAVPYWNRLSQQADDEDGLDDEDQQSSDSDEADDLDQDDDTPVRQPVLQQWPGKPLSALRIDPRKPISVAPDDEADLLLRHYARQWQQLPTVQKSLAWDAPNIRYQPLYFEDVNLERYGNVVRNDYFQTIASAAHFFSASFLLPLHMRQDPVYGCEYPLGYCRPGDCTNHVFLRSFWGRAR